MDEKLLHKKVMDNEKLYMAIKALTAMKLTKEDSQPGEIMPNLFLGSIGAAYNKAALHELGITHVLTAASNIKPRLENVSSIVLTKNITESKNFWLLNALISKLRFLPYKEADSEFFFLFNHLPFSLHFLI